MDLPKYKSKTHSAHYHKRKTASKKIVDKLTYNPSKHKQKVTRTLRKKLQQKTIPPVNQVLPPPPTVKFGSFNVNGLDVEAAWTIEQLLKQRGFDVSHFIIIIKI